MKTLKESIEDLKKRLIRFENGDAEYIGSYTSLQYIIEIKMNAQFVEESIIQRNLSTLSDIINRIKKSGLSPCRKVNTKTINIPDLGYNEKQLKAITKKKAELLSSQFENLDFGEDVLIEVKFPITKSEKSELERQLKIELDIFEKGIKSLKEESKSPNDFISAIEKHKKKHKDFVPKITTEALSIFINLLRDKEFIFKEPQTLLALLIGYPFGYEKKNLSDNIGKTNNLTRANYDAVDELSDFLFKIREELLRRAPQRPKGLKH